VNNNTCVTDLAFGDAGKGTVVNRLCNEHDVSVVVRHNGGCQAAHSVVTDDGRQHTFAQFGSGTFWRVPTFLSKYALVEPLSLLVEARHLEEVGVVNPLDLMFVSPEAVMTTPYHWLLNRWREEQRGAQAHGTCGRGVGATAEYALLDPDALRVGDLVDPIAAVDKLAAILTWAHEQSDGEVDGPRPDEVLARYDEFCRTVKLVGDGALRASAQVAPIVFEGAQGVLLDEDWGFHPHTTWSHTTPRNAALLCEEYGLGDLDVIGVTRAYTTRHGAGPFVAEDPTLDLPEPHNSSSGAQGAWRVGHFDGPAVRYAVNVVRSSWNLTGIYVTHVDSVTDEAGARLCVAYVGPDAQELRILPLLAVAFDAREAQTRRLQGAKPILRPFGRWPEEDICDFLEAPMYGFSRGPCTSEGVFTAGARA
jgi:adenylosuccinate synthase